MFWTAKVTSKGQITLPKELREYLNLRTGDRVAFVVRGDVVTVEPPGENILDWYGALADQAPSADLSAVRESVRRSIAAETVREGETA